MIMWWDCERTIRLVVDVREILVVTRGASGGSVRWVLAGVFLADSVLTEA